MDAEVTKKRGRPRKLVVEAAEMEPTPKTPTTAKPTSLKKATTTTPHMDTVNPEKSGTRKTAVRSKSKMQQSEIASVSNGQAGASAKSSSKILKALEEGGASRPFTAPQAATKSPRKPVSSSSIEPKQSSSSPTPRTEAWEKSRVKASEVPLTKKDAKDLSVSPTARATVTTKEPVPISANSPAGPVQSVPMPQVLAQTFSPTVALLKEKSPSRTTSPKAVAPSSTNQPVKPASIQPVSNPKPPPPPPKAPPAPLRRDPMRPTNPSAPVQHSPGEPASAETPKSKGLPGTYNQNLRRITLIIVALPVAIVTSYHLYERYFNGVEPRRLPSAVAGKWDLNKLISNSKDEK